jgi:hypothetical protein
VSKAKAGVNHPLQVNAVIVGRSLLQHTANHGCMAPAGVIPPYDGPATYASLGTDRHSWAQSQLPRQQKSSANVGELKLGVMDIWQRSEESDKAGSCDLCRKLAASQPPISELRKLSPQVQNFVNSKLRAQPSTRKSGAMSSHVLKQRRLGFYDLLLPGHFQNSL